MYVLGMNPFRMRGQAQHVVPRIDDDVEASIKLVGKSVTHGNVGLSVFVPQEVNLTSELNIQLSVNLPML
jgi:hypothetical protein